MTHVAGTPQATDAPWTRFDRWAAVVLMVAVLVVVFATVAVAGAAQAEPWVRNVVIVSGLLSALVLVSAWAGLARGSSWARPLAIILLWLIILSGLLGAVEDLAAGKIPIPLLAIAAGLTLRTRPAQRLPAVSGRARRVVVVGVAASLLSAVLGPVASYLLKPGNSPLSVPPDALDLRTAIACTYQSGIPSEARLTATWAWRQHEWLAMGEDALALRWLVTDTERQPLPYRFDLRDAPGTGYTPGVNPGRAGATGPFWLGTSGPSGDRANELVQEAESRGANMEPVVVEIDRQGLRDDTFFVVLAAQSAIDSSGVAHTVLPEHGSLGFDVAYLHLGRWTVWADSSTCTW